MATALLLPARTPPVRGRSALRRLHGYAAVPSTVACPHQRQPLPSIRGNQPRFIQCCKQRIVRAVYLSGIKERGAL